MFSLPGKRLVTVPNTELTKCNSKTRHNKLLSIDSQWKTLYNMLCPCKCSVYLKKYTYADAVFHRSWKLLIITQTCLCLLHVHLYLLLTQPIGRYSVTTPPKVTWQNCLEIAEWKPQMLTPEFWQIITLSKLDTTEAIISWPFLLFKYSSAIGQFVTHFLNWPWLE